MTQAGLVVAGTHSGCGKTSVALGMMAALVDRGFRVQPFKVGPDFIDPGHHGRITGRQSFNLDGWMLSPEYNRELFFQKTRDADVAIVEGVMGLFDGFSGKEESGSTAQIAKWLDLPVLLVIDAKSMARSAAALAQGYCDFDPELYLNKVIFNRVGSEAHREILQEAMHSLPQIEVVAHLPREEKIQIPSRHLGLVTQQEFKSDEQRINSLAQWIGENLSLDMLIKRFSLHQACFSETNPDPGKSINPSALKGKTKKMRIAVARDEAFCFYYPDNLNFLQELGAQIICFSPLQDLDLPEDISAMYLGGGYPELGAQRLSANSRLKSQILDHARNGLPVYAECGGFMYLMQELTDIDGKKYPMVGLFALGARMESKFKALGYREICIEKDSILGPANTICRGHEFHYSSIQKDAFQGDFLYEVTDRKGRRKSSEGYACRNVLASYIHLHWGSNPKIPRHFLSFAANFI